MSQAPDEVPLEIINLYKQLIDTHPEVELKGGKKLPYTSLNGNMYTMLSKAGRLGLRLGKAEREAFVERYNSQPFTNYGAMMKEYVEVPADLLRNLDELAPYLAMSHEYAKTLKPKKTKK